jgi:putative peptidoglycan lipid II flippase
MFLRAGLAALTLLVASRLLGLLRETALAAAFGASGQGDVAVLMFSLPDWLAGVLASGALAYVMLPAWAGRSEAQVAATQRRLAHILVAGGVLLGLATALLREELLDLLAPGLQGELRRAGALSLAWCAAAVPLALLASLWVTRLQHERRFTPMYGANLVVNAVLIATLAAVAAGTPGAAPVTVLGVGLLAAMLLRLAFLRANLPAEAPAEAASLPAGSVWLWAALAAGLPLALPFAARSIVSGSGEGALATFNYAWKLVELPLMLAIQLVATIAFPAIARAFAQPAHDPQEAAQAVRPALALAWALACAAAIALLLAAPGIAQLIFGWGRMDPRALANVADWARTGAWGLLPQAVIAVSLTVLAARHRMRPAVFAFAAALLGLGLAVSLDLRDGAVLMRWLNVSLAFIALVVAVSLGREALHWAPWRALGASLAALLLLGLAGRQLAVSAWPVPAQLGAAAIASALVLLVAFAASPDMRKALRR